MIHPGKTGTLVHVSARRFGVVEERISEGLHTFPAITGTGIGNDRASRQQGEIPVTFNVLMVIGVVTSADEGVKDSTGSRAFVKRIDPTHQRGCGERTQRLLGSESRTGERIAALCLSHDPEVVRPS